MERVGSIWLVPNQSDEIYLTSIINSLAEGFNTPTFMPHLTLMGDLRADPNDLIKIVDEIFENTEHFEVKKKKVDQSDKFTKTVFIETELNQQLEELFISASEKTDKRSIDNYTPHISLIYKDMPESYRRGIINGLDIKDKFTIGKVVVVDNKKKTETIQDVKGWEIIYEKELK